MYMNGKMIYEMLKRSYKYVPKFAYRTYFSQYLVGLEISYGLNAINPLLDLYIKTMNLQAKATSNVILNRAKVDNIVAEINKLFWDKRTKEMQDANNTTYQPPVPVQPQQQRPTQVTPQQLREMYAQQKGQANQPAPNATPSTGGET